MCASCVKNEVHCGEGGAFCVKGGEIYEQPVFTNEGASCAACLSIVRNYVCGL